MNTTQQHSNTATQCNIIDASKMVFLKLNLLFILSFLFTLNALGQALPKIGFGFTNKTINQGDTLHFVNTSVGFTNTTEFILNFGIPCDTDVNGQPIVELCNDTLTGFLGIDKVLIMPGNYQVKLKATFNGVTYSTTQSVVVLERLDPQCIDNNDCNIVNNGDFETVAFCPVVPQYLGSNYITSNLSPAATCAWIYANYATPDLWFNSAGTTGCTVNTIPIASGHGGSNAMAGLLLIDNIIPSIEYKEFVEQELKHTLVPNTQYLLRIWTRLTTNSILNSNTTSRMQVAFTNGLFTDYASVGSLVLPNGVTPLTSSSNLLLDNTWHAIDFFYTPSTSDINHIIIGNFAANSDPILNAGNANGTVYAYIDDVSLFPINGLDATVTSNCNGTGNIILSLPCSTATQPFVQPFTFNWSNSSTMQNLNNVSSGSYTVIVTDANNVTVSATYVIPPNAPITPPDIDGDHSVCGSNVFTVTNVNPNLNYTWSINNVIGGFGTTATYNFNVLNPAGGTVIFTATDPSSGCIASTTFSVYPCCTGTYTFTDLTATQAATLFPAAFANCSSCFGIQFSPTGNETLAINGTFTIDQDFIFDHVNVLLGPDATINILDGVKVTFTGYSHLHTCDGNYMWDEIRVNKDAVLILSHTVIEEAKNAIHCIKGGTVNTNTNTVFNANNVSLFFDMNNVMHSGIIQKTKFQSNDITTGLPITLIAPFGGQRPQSGIRITEALTIKIGNENNNNINPPDFRNTFTNLNCGIEIINSQAELVNNAFDKIFPTQSILASSGYGVYINDNTLTPQLTTIGGANLGTVKRSNTFSDCSNGIFATGKINATIQNNIFNFIGVGNLIPNAPQQGKCITAIKSSASIYSINSNTFSNFVQGIHIRNFEACSLLVYGNYFNSSGAISTISNTGILLRNVVSTTMPSTSLVKGNIIKHCIFGINVSGFDEITVAENNIEITDADVAAIPNTFYGIQLLNSTIKGVIVETNTITKTGGNPSSALETRLVGINVQTSENSIVSSNVIYKMGTGIRYFNTALTNTVSCNEMDKNYIGLKLESANIGDQGNASASQDNKWSNLHFDVYGIGNSIYPTSFYAQSSILPWTPITLFLSPSIPITYSFPLAPSLNNCAMPCIPCQRAALLNIINETGDFSLLSAEEQYQAVLAAYTTLKADTSLMNYGDTNDLDLQLFYNDVDQNNAGRLANASALVNHDSSAAATIVSTVAPVNAAEENMRILLEIYGATWARANYILSDEQFNQLYAIAMQNPISGGGAVYGARIMTETDVDDFANTANKGGYSSKLISLQPYNKGRLFPNPSNEIVYYSLRLKKEQHGTLSLFDITGKPLQTIAINNWQNYTPISLHNYNSGMYILKVTVDNKLFETLKFVKQ